MSHDGLIIDALLGAGTRYEGKLCFDGTVRIDGEFEGNVSSEGLLIVGDGGVVRGSIKVGTLIVRGGEVEADIEATELVELHASARVRGDIQTPALFVDKGASFDGSCVMGEVHPLEMPSEAPNAGPVPTDYRDQPTRN